MLLVAIIIDEVFDVLAGEPVRALGERRGLRCCERR
jgi:hypothetical protein